MKNLTLIIFFILLFSDSFSQNLDNNNFNTWQNLAADFWGLPRVINVDKKSDPVQEQFNILWSAMAKGVVYTDNNGTHRIACPELWKLMQDGNLYFEDNKVVLNGKAFNGNLNVNENRDVILTNQEGEKTNLGLCK